MNVKWIRLVQGRVQCLPTANTAVRLHFHNTWDRLSASEDGFRSMELDWRNVKLCVAGFSIAYIAYTNSCEIFDSLIDYTLRLFNDALFIIDVITYGMKYD
jgi:hypothetical protein